MNKWIIVIILVVIEILAQYCISYSTRHKDLLYKYLGMILYLGSGYYYYELLLITDDLGTANVLWTCGTFIGVSFLALALNKSALSLRKIVASILIVIGLILYEY